MILANFANFEFTFTNLLVSSVLRLAGVLLRPSVIEKGEKGCGKSQS